MNADVKFFILLFVAWASAFIVLDVIQAQKEIACFKAAGSNQAAIAACKAGREQ